MFNLNQHFLTELDKEREKTLYAKIILLNFEELPLYEIQGRITSGSLSLDGASAVRRTCSLTLVTKQGEIDNLFWGLHNKFKLEIGVENNIETNYEDIIWFKQGTFIISSLNESINTTSHNITIQGKDKMCMLNGEVGGTLTSSVDFGKLEEYEYTGSYVEIKLEKEEYKEGLYYIYDAEKKEYSLCNDKDWNKKEKYYYKEQILKYTYLPIRDIITNALHIYANEPLYNIVINDLDDYGVELLEYRGDSPMYMIKNINTGVIENVTFDGKQKYYPIGDAAGMKLNSDGTINLEDIPDNKLEKLISQAKDNDPLNFITVDRDEIINMVYTAIKIEYGDAAGYRKTELTYPGDLIGNVGENIVAILDKIKNMFSNFEYFYDIDGRFIFQKKKTYINNSWNNIKVTKENEYYVEPSAYTSSSIYSFEDGELLTAFTNNPNIANLKNDYSIWGVRKGVNGAELPIHLRYSIDYKAKCYRKLEEDKVYYSEELEKEKINIRSKDELIKVDWREIIYQMALDYYKFNHQYEDFQIKLANRNPELYPLGVTGYEHYYVDLQGFWRQLYDPSVIGKKGKNGWEIIYDEKSHVSRSYSVDSGWSDAVINFPETLNFWFDFMDAGSEMGKMAISRIGLRTKAINDNNIKAVYYKEVPNIIFITPEEYANLIQNDFYDFQNMSGYTFIFMPEQYSNYFSISARGKSAWDELNNLLYQHALCAEAVTLTSIPIFHLQPNTRIFVKDEETKINGEYILSKITVPLTYNGTSSLTATRAVERIY